jgi:hypothetical protein
MDLLAKIRLAVLLKGIFNSLFVLLENGQIITFFLYHGRFYLKIFNIHIKVDGLDANYFFILTYYDISGMYSLEEGNRLSCEITKITSALDVCKDPTFDSCL